MKTELIHFRSTDGILLPGLLYRKMNSKKVALYLHGNGTSSIMYSPLMNELAAALENKDIAFFPFNNRGAHLIKSLKKWSSEPGQYERILGGTAYELIKDCIQDINGAIAYLRKEGFTTFYIIGESTGANKIVIYHYYEKNNPFSKYILLSGGDDTGITYKELGPKKFKKALEKACVMIEKGRGDNLVPKYLSPLPYSYKSLYDVANPDGDYNIFPYIEYTNKLHLSKKILFREFASLNKPTLVVYGELDEFCYGKTKENIDILKKHSSSKYNSYHMIEGADHGFSEHHNELIKIITDWIA